MLHGVNMLIQRILDEQRQKRGPGGTAQETLARVQARMLHEFTKLKTQLETVEADAALTSVGKNERSAAAAKEVLKNLASLKTAQTENETHIEQLRQVLFTVPRPTGDPVLNFLREQEHRSSVKDLPQGGIVTAYAQAFKDGNHERVRALTEGPVGSLIPEDVRTRVQIQHAEKTQPAVFQNFQRAGLLKEHLDSLDDHVRQVLADLGAKA